MVLVREGWRAPEWMPPSSLLATRVLVDEVADFEVEHYSSPSIGIGFELLLL